MLNLDAATMDRAIGAFLGTAAGDALGAGYEGGPPLRPDVAVTMLPGGVCARARGEWTDDTAMAWAIAEVAAAGFDLRDEAALDRLAARWADWARTAPDIGIHTAAVFATARAAAGAEGLATPSARHVREAAAAEHARTGRSGGNGSLMRTAPVALAYLADEAALVEAATMVSALTHPDAEAAQACVLWSLAIRHAVLTGKLDVRVGLDGLDAGPRVAWAERLDAAEAAPPTEFPRNGWVVHALQAAVAAIAHAPGLVPALERAVRAGGDTDTVAAIAGGLLGAVHGASAVPGGWVEMLQGWPGGDAADLVSLARTVAESGARSDDPSGVW